jgi:hypothetical protein
MVCDAVDEGVVEGDERGRACIAIADMTCRLWKARELGLRHTSALRPSHFNFRALHPPLQVPGIQSVSLYCIYLRGCGSVHSRSQVLDAS